jgi:glycosyltransferase involved in cell wall biosynthesis
MLKILIDGRRAQGPHAGVGHYTESIVRHWPATDAIEVLLAARRPAAGFGGAATRRLRGGASWNIRAAIRTMRTNSLFFSPESYIVPWMLGRRAAITVHDMTTFDIPGSHTRRNVIVSRLFLPSTLRRVGAIIVPTEAVKADLLRHFPLVEAKVTVIHEGIRDFADGTPTSNIDELLENSRPYVLYVGTIEPRKNVLELIDAFFDVAPATWHLVLAGKAGWLSEEDLERLEKAGEHERVALLGYVPGEWLRPLFTRAALFAYVSESEGFGLPVAEAMAAGVPVIHSDDPALLEVGSGAGIVVRRAFLAEDLRAALVRAIAMEPEERDAMVARGIAASRKYDWAVAAEETSRVVKSLRNVRAA